MRISKKILVPFLIFITAFALRISAVILTPQNAPDSEGYIKLAVNISEHGMFSLDGKNPSDHRAPLFPAIIALNHKIFGPSFEHYTLITNALLDSCSTLLTYALTLTLSNNPFTAACAAAIYTIHPELLGSNIFILSETPSVFFLLLSFFLLVLAIKKEKKILFILSAICMTAEALCRPAILLFPFFVIFVIPFARKKKILITGTILFLIFFMLTLSPWTIRNYKQFGKFIPVSSNFGESLWAGSMQNWNGKYNPEIMQIRSNAGHKVNYKGKGYYLVDNYLKKEAMQRITKDPAGYIILCLKKAIYFWTGLPGAEEVLKRKPLLAILFRIFHYSLIVLAIVGLIQTTKNQIRNPIYLPLLCIIYYTLIHSALMALPRYRIPILPFVIFYAAHGITQTLSYYTTLMPAKHHGQNTH